jgi:HAE1 family hydrophobic/amphiphilic exporter-1
LPDALQQRATESGEIFVPEAAVTRTNLSPSLQIVVYKDAEANTVSTYADVERLIQRIDDENDDIVTDVVFEQSTFVEESISGVAREGGLGAVFAIIIILVFLSGGIWARNRRQLVGAAMGIGFVLLLIGLVATGLDAAGNNWGDAFSQADPVFSTLLMVGVFAGAVVLFYPGDLPDPAWRATIVIAVSIPLSIMMAFVFMHWFSPFMHNFIEPLAENSGFFDFILRLFPDQLTLNIMTLSGLTVAVGRVVDDSIVVLENIFRELQRGEDKLQAILDGTRDVSAAIFIATVIAVVVFLPLGLTGGIIGAFFLPFGLAVTYALAGSFIVAVTVVPALVYFFVSVDDIPEEKDIWIAAFYVPVLKWALSSGKTKAFVIFVAFASMIFGFYLLSQRPAAFLPDFGEPQISVSVEMPGSTSIIETNALVKQMEQFITETIDKEEITAIQTTIGGSSGFESFFGGGSVSENQAEIVIGLDVDTDTLDERTVSVREAAESVFGEANVTVSNAADEGFGGFELVVSGPIDELVALDPLVIETLNNLEGLTNVSSNISEAVADSAGDPTFIRVNLKTAASYSADVETDNTIGIIQEAIDAVKLLPEFPENIEVSQGFDSEVQTQGFNSLPIAMGIAMILMIIILIFTFQSTVYWLALILSIVVVPVGAAVALTITNRVLGISALIGLLMLLGLVVTNAIVLIDRVRSNVTERNMTLYDALVEAGGRRLRPILMTSTATIIALIPLAIGLSEGAIIASELGTVVIGGVVSSTLLTLIVVPVAYSLLTPIHRFLSYRGRRPEETAKANK